MGNPEKQGFIRERIPNFIQLGIACAVIGVSYQHVLQTKYEFPAVNTLERRMAFTLRCLLISALPIVAVLGGVLRGRFRTAAINQFSGNEKTIELDQRILQNTIEQFILHASTLLAMSTIVTDDTVKLIPYFTVLFVAGRFSFIIGYNIHQKGRALGFGLTCFSTLLAGYAVLSQLYRRGISTF